MKSWNQAVSEETGRMRTERSASNDAALETQE